MSVHPTSFYCDDETGALLAKLMDQTGLSRSALLRQAVKEMAAADPKQRRKVLDALSTLNAALAP